MSISQKAVRATINLGDIEVDCYQLPDGSYGYSYEWLAQYLSIDKQLLSNKKSPFYLYNHNKAISKQALSSRRVLVEGISNAKLNYLTSDELMIVLGSLSAIAPKVVTLLVACAIEALERRADSAFGKVRTEQERNDKLAARAKGIVARRTLTDAIADYILRHHKTAPYTTFVWSNVSDCLNKRVLGAKAKDAHKQLALSPSASLRDAISQLALTELELAENYATRLIDNNDIEPLTAAKQALANCFIKQIGCVV